VEEQTEIAHVATISAQDEKIGELIAEAFSKVARTASSPSRNRRRWASSWNSPKASSSTRIHFSVLHHRPERLEAVLDDPYILIHQSKISSMADFLRCSKRSRSEEAAAVIAEDVEGERWPPSCEQAARLLNVVAVKAPLRRPPQGHAGRRRRLTAHRVTEELGTKLESVEIDSLGRARRVVITRTTHDRGRAGDKTRSRQIRQIRTRSTTPTPTGQGEAAGAAGQAVRRRLRPAVVPPPRWSSRRRSTAWRTPSPPLARPSRKASSPAAQRPGACRHRPRDLALPATRQPGCASYSVPWPSVPLDRAERGQEGGCDAKVATLPWATVTTRYR